MDAIIATKRYLRVVSQARCPPSFRMASTPKLYKPPVDRAAAFAQAGLAGPLRDRLLRPGARAKRQRRVRGRDVQAVAALSDFTAVLVGAIAPEHLAFANG